MRVLIIDAGFADQAAISNAMGDMQIPIAEHSAPLAAVLALLRAKCTMDAERRIHEQLFGKDRAAPPVLASEASAATDLDDLFF